MQKLIVFLFLSSVLIGVELGWWHVSHDDNGNRGRRRRGSFSYDN